MDSAMKNKTELRAKIIDGIRAAFEKLITSSIKNGDYLVISRDGKIIKVSAMELQKKH
jgi:hypothetical protein